MQTKLLLGFLLLFIAETAVAQTAAEPGTARSLGLGGIGSTLGGADALFSNGAGLPLDSTSGLLVGYHTLFSLPELTTWQAGGYRQFKQSSLGATVTRYGTGAYHQHHFSAVLAHRLQNVSLAVKAGLVQIATTGFASRRVVVISAGGITQLVPKLRLGAYAYNLNAQVLEAETGEKLPTLLQIGLNWQTDTKLDLYAEVEKELDASTRTKLGLEYVLLEKLKVRAGFRTQPATTFAGLGWWHNTLRLDYAAQLHRYLGLRHHLTFALLWP